jgi:NAD(P)-dependent dehydrogenase (short-subunit alcohol dehydrogenase family)
MISTMKTALVTGANKGIGRAIAKGLARQGYTVWIGARDARRGEAAAEQLRDEGLDVRFLQLDVGDDSSAKAAATSLAGHTDHLDVLVNNAGVALEGMDGVIKPSTLEMAKLKATYEVNVFGPVRVTQAFVPLLRKAPAARIVMMSSSLGSLSLQADPNGAFTSLNLLAYSSSKTALNGVTVAFAKEFRETPIKINAACPGYVATDLNANSGTRTVEQGATIALRLATLPADGPSGGYFNEDGPLPW